MEVCFVTHFQFNYEHQGHFCLLDELCWMPFKPFLTCYATEMVSFAFISDLELGSLLVQNDAANWIFRHYLILNLTLTHVNIME